MITSIRHFQTCHDRKIPLGDLLIASNHTIVKTDKKANMRLVYHDIEQRDFDKIP